VSTNDNKELMVIWHLKNTDGLIVDDFVLPYEDDGSIDCLTAKKDWWDIADQYRLVKRAGAPCRLQGLYQGDWINVSSSGQVINYLLNENQNLKNEIKSLKCEQ
jgi:hypothetical protein